MSQWYLSKNGQALGPLEEDKLIALIHAGDVSPVDLVYQAGATEWLPISEVAELSQHFNKKSEEPEPVPKSGDGSKEWVLLKKVQSEKGREYKQFGPFTMDHVFEMIDAGEIRFTDFAWKQGMDTWAKISDIQEFSMPLPSSPKVDTSIYEKTNVDIDAETVTDAKQRASLTHLVSIEKFDHERTMVQPSGSSLTPPPASKKEADDEIVPLNTTDLEIPPEMERTEVTQDSKSPINSQDFVTESGVGLDEDDESDAEISLWSLEPPSSKNVPLPPVDGDEATRVATAQESPKKKPKSKKEKPKKKPKPKPKDKKPRENPFSKVSPETWQWIAAVGAVVLGVFFFAMSFKVDNGEVVYDENSELGQQLKAQQPPPAKPFKPEEVSQKMENYKKAIEEARVAPSPSPQQENRSRLPKDLARKMIPTESVPQPSPKVPLREKVTNKILPEPKQPTPSPKMKKVAKKPAPKPAAPVQPKPAPTTKRQVAGKKKKMAEQIAHMKNTKKKAKSKSKPKPAKKKVVKKTIIRTSQAPRVAKAAGGRKSQSFYRQRDRMALFYSSLKAETLSVDIAREYKKLRSNKRAWANFYGQWRAKVRKSLSQDIKNFP